MATLELQVQNNIQTWLDNQVTPSMDELMVDWIHGLANRQLTAAVKISQAPDYGQSAARLLKQSLADPRWEFGEYALPLYELLSSSVYHSHRDQISEIKEALEQYEAKWFRIISDEALTMMLGKRLVSAMGHFPVFKEIQDRYLLVSHWDNYSWCDRFMETMEDNQELVGSQHLVFNNQPASPTIANWLEDLRLSVGSAAGGDPGQYDLLKYFNNTPYIAALDKDDKARLSEILRIYFWLHNPVLEQASIDEYERSFDSHEVNVPSEQLYEQIFAAMDKQVKPKMVQDIRPRQASSSPPGEMVQPRVIRPVQPRPQPISQPQPRPQPTPQPSRPRYTPPDNVNIQKILNSDKYTKNGQGSGIVFDQESNVKVEEMAQRLEAERQQQKVKIDQKLEALKKRKKI